MRQKYRAKRRLDRYFGRVLCHLLSLVERKRRGIENIQSVLFVRLWALGESILTLPTIRSFHKKYPNSKIYVLATPRVKEVFTGMKEIDRIFILKLSLKNILANYKMIKKLKSLEIDIAIDFETYLRTSALLAYLSGAKVRIGFSNQVRSKLYNLPIPFNDQVHKTKAYSGLLDPLGVNWTENVLLKPFYSLEDKRDVEKQLKGMGITPKDLLVGLCVATGNESAKWPIKRFATLADKLISKFNGKIVLIGSKEEKERSKKILKNTHKRDKIYNLTGKTTLKQLFYLCERCDLFISRDTGPMHVAAAMGTRTIGIFGGTNPKWYAPLNTHSSYLHPNIPCAPCVVPHKEAFPKCKNPGCLKKIKISEVICKAKSLLGKKGD